MRLIAYCVLFGTFASSLGLATQYTIEGIFARDEHSFNGSLGSPNLQAVLDLTETDKKLVIKILLTIPGIYGIESAESETLTFTKKKVGDDIWLMAKQKQVALIKKSDGDFTIPLELKVKANIRGTALEYSDVGRLGVEHSGVGTRIRGSVPAVSKDDRSHFFVTELFKEQCPNEVAQIPKASRAKNSTP